MTLGETLAAATQSLEENRIPSPRLTAEVLLAHCIQIERARVYSHSDDPISNENERAFRSMLGRRVRGEPLQYITGVQEFYGRTFHVDPSVLIPRPETEFVIETVLEQITRSGSTLVDIGTGSGCIACTLALELPSATVSASDVSLGAVQTARRNAHALGAPVNFACLESLDAWSGPFDAVISNPPYVRSDEHDGLQREVRDFEPGIALVGDGNPLGLYRHLCSQALERLVEGGLLVFEIGFSMEEAIRGFFGSDWELLPTRCDLQGIPRVIAARKR